MWFGWIIDIGFPGPDRGEGGKYLVLPPGYDGPLPDSGFFVGHSKTNHVLYAVRAFMEKNDPKPAVELIKKTLKIIPTHRAASAQASRQPSKAASSSHQIRPFPRQVRRGQRQVVQHHPAERLLLLRDARQARAARAGNLLQSGAPGQLAAIGIVKGKPFNPDDSTQKILTDAAAVGNAAVAP